MKKNVLVLIIITLAFSLFAKEQRKNGFGFSLGMISGFGLSYRRMEEKFGFQATIGKGGSSQANDMGWESSWEDTTSTQYSFRSRRTDEFNYGLSCYYFLLKSKNTTFYILAAGTLYHKVVSYNYYEYEYNEINDDWYFTGKKIRRKEDPEDSVNTGYGIGFEFRIFANLHLSFEWTHVHLISLTDIDDEYKGEDNYNAPQIGIHLYF